MIPRRATIIFLLSLGTIAGSVWPQAAAILWASTPAQAQSGATDNELYAAYCIGVMDERIGTGAPSADPQKEQYERSVTAPWVQLRQRFQTYLLSTGAIADPQRVDAALGLTAAARRGHTDMQQCLAALTTKCNRDACGYHYSTPSDPLGLRGPSPTQSKCIFEYLKTCQAQQPSCVRESRCDGPDTLPF